MEDLRTTSTSYCAAAGAASLPFSSASAAVGRRNMQAMPESSDECDHDIDYFDDLPSSGKLEQACALIKGTLANGPARATDIRDLLQRESVSGRTMTLAKSMLSIKSFRQGGVWYWTYKDKTERGKKHDAD